MSTPYTDAEGSVNPVKYVRKNILRMTMEELIDYIAVSKTLIIKNEQGTYPRPSALIMKFYSRWVDNWDDEDFERAYAEWQVKHRKENYGLLLIEFPIKHYLENLPVGRSVGRTKSEPYYHPFEMWRLYSRTAPNINQISKAFCIHQGLLHKFENQTHLVNSVPEPVWHGLMDAGYSQETLMQLEFCYQEYKQYLRNLNLRVNDATDSHATPTAKLL